MSSTLTLVHGPTPPCDWLDAGPLRTHVRHLMEAAGLGVEAIAALAGVPVRATRSLAEGRGGRPVRRVHVRIARRLLRVTTADARRTRILLVAVSPVRARLRCLIADTSLEETAAGLGLSPHRIVELLTDAEACTQAEALTVLATHRAVRGRAGPQATRAA